MQLWQLLKNDVFVGFSHTVLKVYSYIAHLKLAGCVLLNVNTIIVLASNISEF